MRHFFTIICATLLGGTLFWLSRAKWPLGVRGEWVITPGAAAWPAPAWGLPLAVLLIFGGLAALSAYDRFRRAKSEKEKRGSTRLCVLALTLLAFAWPWALLGPGGTANLIAGQWSDLSNEYFATAYEIENAREFSHGYAALRQKPLSVLMSHVATHPPGAVLFYYGARRVYEASPFLQSSFGSLAEALTSESISALATQSNEIRAAARPSVGVRLPAFPLPSSAVGAAMWGAFLISLLLASCIPATYFMASLPAGDGSTPEADEARGLTAAALLALAPVVSLFAFTFDALIAAGAAWTLAFLALRLRGGQAHWLVLAGAMLALTSFVSFGALAIAAIVIIALLFARSRMAPLEIAIFCAGFTAMWLVLMIVFPMQPWSIFRNAMANHHLVMESARSRFAWIGMNVFSYAVFCGWPLFIGAVAGGALFSRAFWKEKFAFRARVGIPVVIGTAALVTMIFLTLSGAARGEVERLWLFLTPSLAVLAAACWTQRNDVKRIAILLSLQAGQTLVMAAWLAPLVRPL